MNKLWHVDDLIRENEALEKLQQYDNEDGQQGQTAGAILKPGPCKDRGTTLD